MAKNIETLSEELSSVSAHITEIRKDVNILEKLVLTGNGHESVLARIAVVEDKHSYILKEIGELERKQENMIDTFYKNVKPQGKEKFMQLLKISLILSPGVVALTMQIIKLFIS